MKIAFTPLATIGHDYDQPFSKQKQYNFSGKSVQA